MSYRSDSEKVTLVDELIDLDNQQNMNNILPSGEQNKYTKYIRNSHVSKYPEMNIQQQMMTPNNMESYSQEFYDQQFPQHNLQQPVNKIPSNSPYSCLDIAGHINNCPICSKFYNNDKSLFIVTIVILIIVCALLLKKCLEK